MKNCILVAILTIPALFAQKTPVNHLSGQVLDATRTPIPGAVIIALTPAGATAARTSSGESGDYTFDLPDGPYTIVISKDGFQEARRDVTLAESSATNAIELQINQQHSAVTVLEAGGYLTSAITTATKTPTLLLDVPQSITVISRDQIQDQLMSSVADVVRDVSGITVHQGENNRDQLVIRGNSTSADFFVNGVRDDVQYYRDLYNLERVEALKGPNALIFGRGGAGGVVNRVTKEADGNPIREIDLQGGSFNNKRIATDLAQPLGPHAALRFNAMYEDSGSFRRYVDLDRYGVSPTLSLSPSPSTRISIAFENFHDHRIADRGITSWQNRPADVDIATYYGNPDQANVHALVNNGSIFAQHQSGRLNIQDRLQIANYDRGYQNFVPGVVTPDKTLVSISAYNNATARTNLFNQTDLSGNWQTGRLRHTLLFGSELGRQLTDNFRNTGYFGSATSVLAPYANPLTGPATFRQSATDADNHLVTNLAAVYVQDQVEINRYLQIVAGARFDHFDLQYHNNRNGENLRRIDNPVSPRAGVVIKPTARLSLYGSYSMSFLPSSGDQFSSLTNITQQVKPERFTNHEAGVEWEPNRALSLTAAVYRLDRTNTRATDPNDPTRIVQTGATRSTGVELGASGRINKAWSVSGGYTNQKAVIVSDTTAARAGAIVAQVPRNTFALWNNFRLTTKLGAGLGLVNRTDMFAAIDNTVVVPGFFRADAAVFYSFTERMRLQANVENLFDRRYYANADSNTNISPGNPRAIRIALVARFK